MLPQKKRFVTVFFIGIYVIFGGIFLYLLFFNTGIAIIEELDPDTGIKHLYIENQSKRTIFNISVAYRALGTDDIVEITDLNKLRSGKRYEIIYDFPSGIENVEIIASAPFHQTIAKSIVLRFGETGLKYNFKIPNKIFVNNQFTLGFEICNDADADKVALVEESHTEGFFEEGTYAKSLNIEANSCKDIEYYLTPKKTGQTTIYFKVNVQNISDNRNITITVED